MAEGCVQLMQFYLLFVGVQTCTVDARFQPIPNWPQVVRCRGQVTPAHSLLTYRMEVTAIGLTPSPYAKANVDIIVEDKTVVRFKDLGLQLSEKNPLASPPEERRIQARKPVLFDESHIEAFAAGPIVDCFGPEYAIYETRRMPRTPNGDLKLLSRVLEFNGCRHELKPFSSLVTEYDVPADPWFCRQNACPTTPYSIYMEFALQPCGFLSIHLGSPLVFPEESLYFRNLDGKGRIIRAVDLRGKTITSRVRLLSSTSIQGAIIQKFDFQLTCEEELFYEGDATFGLFTPQALENQVGLDAGREVLPWLESAANVAERLRLHAATRHAFYGPRPGKPHYRLAQGQLDFLDEALIVENGGWHQRGYVYAHRTIDPNDWFFTCHFYQDPVMPGSLGVEAMMQAMQIYALQLDLGKPFKSPCFEQVIDHPIVWKYRGQIVPDHHQMRLEVHLTSIERTEERVILIGEASLWRDNLRIYEVKHIALSLQESKP
jgi:3-hydroxymyristoyl/3-hydroxydecanoyl-(acyl carrier protein) dehydratase